MAVREDDKSIIAYIRQIYPWARYAARNVEGKLSLHNEKPWYINGGMVPMGDKYITLPREFLPSIKCGVIVKL